MTIEDGAHKWWKNEEKEMYLQVLITLNSPAHSGFPSLFSSAIVGWLRGVLIERPFSPIKPESVGMSEFFGKESVGWLVE
ncbi:unnamed protein product [Allacma fusca]|uniref:Uncharacterized protein n=1 Tax=Allacma fusca TaxID=39272 RepID=A0A8J2PFP4_9HEXA|nr:unnamed protein product [Allacma fusca]